jgi:hypothetical protein
LAGQSPIFNGATAVIVHGVGVQVWIVGVPNEHDVGVGDFVYPSAQSIWQVDPLASVVWQLPNEPNAGVVMVQAGAAHDCVEVSAPFKHVTSVPTVLKPLLQSILQLVPEAIDDVQVPMREFSGAVNGQGFGTHCWLVVKAPKLQVVEPEVW